jgi:hypothetical protein
MRLLIFFLLFQVTQIVMADNEEEYAPLDPGAFAYVYTDVKRSRPILDILPVGELRTWQAVIVLDSTNIAAAALFPKESGRRFQVTGWGNYPSFRAGIALFFHKNWKRRRDETGYYWYNNTDKLSIILNPKQVFAISWLSPPLSPVPESPGVRIPAGFTEFHGNSPLSCWMENPGNILDKMLSDGGFNLTLPAQMLFINLDFMGQNLFQTVIRMQFEDERRAGDVAALLSLAGESPPRNESSATLASVFFTYPPVQDGSTLEIRSAILTEKEISLLLKLFLLYW